ncbi:MAG TPA: ABC transporter ATP-binding protein [Thermoanaerobaculia bacterium]|nr:ABC transporter ATP-binding protein [Thermoanaerobaculia bacterium]
MSDSDPGASASVVAENLGKTYRLYRRPADRLVELVTGSSRHVDFQALENVSFELPRGASLGLIGENGAGKSTLLKLVAGTTAPSEGRVSTRGAVASILELGMGFHPEFSGLDNARINGALLGLSAGEIRRRLPAIREFSELGDFFDRPVKTYSSGMMLRLAFSVATHVDAEVLIVDEALAVGDGYFQKKSVDRIVAFQQGGGTLLFCSHALYYVATLCDRAIWLEHGRVREHGKVLPVVRQYEAYLQSKEERRREAEPAPAPRAGGLPARITDVVVHDGSGFPASEFRSQSTVAFDVAFESTDPAAALTVRIGIDREDGVQVFAADTREAAPALTGRRRYRVRLTLPDFPISHGDFTVFVYLADEHGLHLHDARILSPGFSVVSPVYAVGLVAPPRVWSFPPEPAEPDRSSPSSASLSA